ncbi:LLM class flavin-dependent oxidoreductase [Rhodococcoides kyotonense]|uniref:Flavin-dependent oxidoreductase, luciferase family (Includes alkanesulfonate monooxygenase SsuD and methylene tetrahydromethanopterin reductase) n=1 Tax=Rhodococcoides kyotonense TaxID=398843 RepID=A0A239N0S1_9NOCA|nr:LLM class flavin-dependent oxidoreductase [Rhodococcus kyotonensis]SNT48073.1 Flavin-dependent oxidoreductase, luciferase family (includes alkanesulfonate monooxygenase SsuD and methylene tetrahydromethanopterin reductase) [Rhodococcus kyotonensis]
MIKNFGVLYVGNVIDGDDIGFDGPMPFERRYPSERLTSAFDEALTLAQLSERLGFSTFWMAEHHYQHEGFECIPNIPLLSLWLAQHTTEIKFGCGFNVLPTWHPIRLAEDYAVVDKLTNGRLIFGVGRGYHERELVGMNAQTVGLADDDRRALFEEQVEILVKAFAEESWSHHGRFYDLPPAGATHRFRPVDELTLVPRPNHPVDIWQPTTSGNPRGVEFMARNGINGMIAGMPTPFAGKFAALYQEANRKFGRDLELGENLAVGFRCYLADTEKQAREALRPIYDEYSKFGAPLGVNPFSKELIALHESNGDAVPSDARIMSFDEVLESGAWFAGTAEQFIDRVGALQDELPGLEHVLINLHIPASHRENREQVERIGRDVLPHFTSVPAAVGVGA